MILASEGGSNAGVLRARMRSLLLHREARLVGGVREEAKRLIASLGSAAALSCEWMCLGLLYAMAEAEVTGVGRKGLAGDEGAPGDDARFIRRQGYHP